MGGPPDCLQYYTATSGTVARWFILIFHKKEDVFQLIDFYHSQLQLSYQPKCNRFNKWVISEFSIYSFFVITLGIFFLIATHLSNQNYHVCFRRASGKCGICFVPSITITTAASNVAASQVKNNYKVIIGILFPKLFSPPLRKNCSSDWKKLSKLGAEGREFANILRSLEQFIRTVKRSEQFWKQNAFYNLFLEVSEQLEFKLEKIIVI